MKSRLSIFMLIFCILLLGGFSITLLLRDGVQAKGENFKYSNIPELLDEGSFQPVAANTEEALAPDDFNCGVSTVDYGGQVYNTVQIGSQCWLKENLNVGTMIQSCSGGYNGNCYVNAETPNNQANDSVIEKYCRSNNSANCVTYGGLYQWQEMMNLPASCLTTDCSAQIKTPHRGICPTGWHIPTDAEFNTLELYTLEVINSPNHQYACDTIYTGLRRCADDSGTDEGGTYGVGKSLKKVGQGSGNGAGDDLVGFSAIFTGYRITNGSFSTPVNVGYLWQASQDSAANGWGRYLYTTYSTIYRGSTGKAYGYSVRCLKD